MISDFRRRETGKVINADVCIIGAGAAGLTLARSFIGSNIQVCLLESGGFEFDYDIQSLYEGEDVGLPEFYGLDGSRLRFFGGSTNHWGGWCAPLSDIDFKNRKWVPFSGWPIKKKDLDQYYKQVHEILDLGPYRYDTEELSDADRNFPAFLQKKIITRLWRIVNQPTLFGDNFRGDLEKARNVKVYLYANVIDLKTNRYASNVQTVNIRTLNGKTGSVKAKHYVIASGGIETARLLLLSNSVEKKGLGNRNDLVGRFYMTHPHIKRTAMISSSKPDELGCLFRSYNVDGVEVRPGFCPSSETQKQEQILNCSSTIASIVDEKNGYIALTKIINEFKRLDWPDDFGEKLGTVISDLDSAAARLKGVIRGAPYIPPVTEVFLFPRIEQSPNPDSCVSLSEQRDSLGQNRTRLNWQLNELDKRTVRIFNRLIGEELGRMNMGRIRLADWLISDEGAWPEEMMGFGHHMGTTRMSDDPKQGVVDSNCRVHYISNLYINSSSVFPTAGHVNPTLTIMALALRLADHLKGLTYS